MDSQTSGTKAGSWTNGDMDRSLGWRKLTSLAPISGCDRGTPELLDIGHRGLDSLTFVSRGLDSWILGDRSMDSSNLGGRDLYSWRLQGSGLDFHTP